MKHLCVLFLYCVLSGCATVNHMAFDKNAKSVDVSSKSVVLMAIDVSRDDDSRYVPHPFVVKVQTPGAKTKEERQNFKMDKDVDKFATGDGHAVYLVRIALTPGQYELMDIMGDANAFPFACLWDVPLLLNFNVPPGSVTYVGRITAKLRPREGDEFRAGPVIPLIDQAACAISQSTWDIAVDDASKRDISLFHSNFPALAAANVTVSLLPRFDRATVQRWWENSTPPKDKDAPADGKSDASGAATDVASAK